jgi:hypothetical protein
VLHRHPLERVRGGERPRVDDLLAVGVDDVDPLPARQADGDRAASGDALEGQEPITV